MNARKEPSSPSSFNGAEGCEALVRRTERNIKRIEIVGRDFVVPVLNEWRYATRHILTATLNENPEAARIEWKKAVSHVKRAYFDSCDILLTCNLSRAKEILDGCAGYRSLVAQIVPEYPSIRARILAAQTASIENDAVTAEEKEERFESLDPVLSDLSEAVLKLSASHDELQEEVRKAVRRDRISLCSLVATLAGIAVGIVSLLLGE